MLEIVESTCPKTAKGKNRWIRFREGRQVAGPEVFVFSDGSSLGGHAAVIVREGCEPTVVSAFCRPTSTRNVGAELNGALLGLKAVPKDSSVVLVCDYLGVAAWLASKWLAKDPEVRERVREMLAVIRANNLHVRYVHHRGHQKPADGDDFTKYNTLADRCSTEANDAR